LPSYLQHPQCGAAQIARYLCLESVKFTEWLAPRAFADSMQFAGKALARQRMAEIYPLWEASDLSHARVILTWLGAVYADSQALF
jgi:hypothetical protein